VTFPALEYVSRATKRTTGVGLIEMNRSHYPVFIIMFFVRGGFFYGKCPGPGPQASRFFLKSYPVRSFLMSAFCYDNDNILPLFSHIWSRSASAFPSIRSEGFSLVVSFGCRTDEF